MMSRSLPHDLGPRLRAHAALLRDLRDDHLAVLPHDAIEALTLLAAASDRMADAHETALGVGVEARQAEAVRLALLGRHGHPGRGESPPGMPEDAAHGVPRLMQRLMQRPAPVPVVPRPRAFGSNAHAAEVLPFRRATAAVPVLFAHETAGGDTP